MRTLLFDYTFSRGSDAENSTLFEHAYQDGMLKYLHKKAIFDSPKQNKNLLEKSTPI